MVNLSKSVKIFAVCTVIIILSLVSCKNNDLNAGLNAEVYLNKIWIVNLSETEEYSCPFSFYITNIDENEIGGRIMLGQPAFPELFLYHFEESQYLGYFTGKIYKEVAECQFSITGSGDTGTLNIYFDEDENDGLKAALNFSNGSHQDFDGTIFNFRPYNLSDDVAEKSLEKEISVLADLNSWGDVYIVTGLVGTVPAMYITDADGNIFYSFGPCIRGFEVEDIIVEDLNLDGLKDIRFLIKAIGMDVDELSFYSDFFQMENGLFYSSDLV